MALAGALALAMGLAMALAGALAMALVVMVHSVRVLFSAIYVRRRVILRRTARHDKGTGPPLPGDETCHE